MPQLLRRRYPALMLRARLTDRGRHEIHQQFLSPLGADYFAAVGSELYLPRRDVRFGGNLDRLGIVIGFGQRGNQAVDRFAHPADHSDHVGALHHRDQHRDPLFGAMDRARISNCRSRNRRVASAICFGIQLCGESISGPLTVGR